MILLVLLVSAVLLLIVFRFRSRFLRVYGFASLILLVYASNKEAFGLQPEWHEATFSPLSATRWVALAFVAITAFGLPVPSWFRFKRPMVVPVLMLVVWMLFSATYSSTSLYSFMRACSFALLAVATLRGLGVFLISRENAANLFELILYMSAIVLLPFLAIRYVSPDLFPVDDAYGHFVGMFANPNTLGGYAALVTPFAIFRWKTGRNPRARFFGLFVLAAIVACVVECRSRGAAIACLLAIAAYFFTVDPRDRIRIVAATLVVLAAFAVFPTLSQQSEYFITRSGEVQRVDEEKRFEIWQGVFPIFWQQKWIGLGFAASHQEVFSFTNDEQAGRSVHNSYLELFGDLGLPGIVLLLVIFVQIGKDVAILMRRQQAYFDRSISAVLVACFIAGATNAFVESWMFSVGSVMAMIYWTVVGGMIGRAVLLTVPTAVQSQKAPAAVAAMESLTPSSTPA